MKKFLKLSLGAALLFLGINIFSTEESEAIMDQNLEYNDYCESPGSTCERLKTITIVIKKPH